MAKYKEEIVTAKLRGNENMKKKKRRTVVVTRRNL